jgi:hypothetical protein
MALAENHTVNENNKEIETIIIIAGLEFLVILIFMSRY